MRPPPSGFPTMQVKRAAVLYAEGDRCEGAWILMRGKVGLAMKSVPVVG